MEHLSQGILTAYIQEELSAQEAASVEQHVSHCEACSKLQQELRSFYGHVSTIQLAPSASFVNNVMNRIKGDEKISSQSWFEIFRNWAIPAFSCIASVILLMNGQGSVVQSSSVEEGISNREQLFPLSGNVDDLLTSGFGSEEIL